MRASATRLFRSVAVEVERKFKPSATAYALLQHGGLGSPGTGRRGEADAYGTSQLDESGGRVTEGEATGVGQWLHDLYLDAPDRRLSCSDRWLRRRGSGFSPTATQEGKLSGLGGQQRWELKRPAMPLGKEATDSEKVIIGKTCFASSVLSICSLLHSLSPAKIVLSHWLWLLCLASSVFCPVFPSFFL